MRPGYNERVAYPERHPSSDYPFQGNGKERIPVAGPLRQVWRNMCMIKKEAYPRSTDKAPHFSRHVRPGTTKMGVNIPVKKGNGILFC
jgi:hypothetical protein